MKLPLDHFQRAKQTVHGVQGLLIFIAWCLTIAVLKADGTDDGRTMWYWTVCWLCLPVLIYQIMVPAWSRAKKFASPYAYATLDGLMTVFWFSAFVAVASWNSEGVKQGESKKSKDSTASGCATFGFGSEAKCRLSEITVGFGVIIFLLFGLTSAMSFYAVAYYMRTGTMPGYAATSDPASVEAQTKDAFSTAPHDDQDDFGSGSGFRQDDDYAPLRADELDEANHPGQKVNWGRQDPHGHTSYDTSYAGAYDKSHQSRQSLHKEPHENPFGDHERHSPYQEDHFDYQDADNSYYGAGRR